MVTGWSESRPLLPVGRAGVDHGSCGDVLRLEAEHLEDGAAVALAEDGALIVAEADTPDGIARLCKLADERAGTDVPELNAAVAAARDDEAVIELQAGDRVVVRAQSVHGREVGQVEDDNTTVRASRNEAISGQLKLSHERGVAGQNRQALSRPRVPDTDGRVQ